MNDSLRTKMGKVYNEFVDIIFPCKNIDFSIRGVLVWAREHATPEQKHEFLCYFYGREAVGAMTGAYQLQNSSAIIYKDPFDKQALEKLYLSKLFDIFNISGCNSEYFSIYFLEYKRVSKIRSRTYMNKVNNQRKEYNDFIKEILK